MGSGAAYADGGSGGPVTLLDPAHEADFKAHLITFEGRTDYLYLDSNGCVTIGVGCMIPSPTTCEALAWEGGMGAAALAVSEWSIVKAAKPGMVASAYARLTTLRLPAVEVDKLLDQRIAGMESDVIHAIPRISASPQEAVQAVLDMSFNCGTARVHSEFFSPGCKFGPALYRGDWQEAALECVRRGIQPARNEYAQALFMAIRPSDIS